MGLGREFAALEMILGHAFPSVAVATIRSHRPIIHLTSTSLTWTAKHSKIKRNTRAAHVILIVKIRHYPLYFKRAPCTFHFLRSFDSVTETQQQILLMAVGLAACHVASFLLFGIYLQKQFQKKQQQSPVAVGRRTAS